MISLIYSKYNSLRFYYVIVSILISSDINSVDLENNFTSFNPLKFVALSLINLSPNFKKIKFPLLTLSLENKSFSIYLFTYFKNQFLERIFFFGKKILNIMQENFLNKLIYLFYS